MMAIDTDDEVTLYLTRGDATHENYNRLAFCFPIKNLTTGEIENYEFQLSDKITFTVFEKKGYTRLELLKKEYTISDLGYLSPTEYPEIILTEEDTKKFNLENTKKVYWYDLVLNNTTTMIGYDKYGGKKLIVFPGAEEE